MAFFCLGPRASQVYRKGTHLTENDLEHFGTDDAAVDRGSGLSYEEYEDLYDPLRVDRQARRKLKPVVQPLRVTLRETVSQLAEPEELEAGFETTYHPSRFEAGWLLSSLRSFYEQGLITDVLALAKGGKEASVYRCAAHPATGLEFLAAKIYRPRMLRNLRNDSLYRQGRETLQDSGRVVKKRERRVMLAIEKKTNFGQLVSHMSWLGYEFVTLRRLYNAGAAVPRPVAVNPNSVLMAYVGDASRAAPTLHEISLGPREARALFDETLRNIELMLSQGLVHADLSAYNILYWEGAIYLIDFPQVIDIHINRSARAILARDVLRVCQYFHGQGVDCDSEVIMRRLWDRYGVQADLLFLEDESA